jgi:hypothetical protein
VLREKLFHRITPSVDQVPGAAGLRVSFHLAIMRRNQPTRVKLPEKRVLTRVAVSLPARNTAWHRV